MCSVSQKYTGSRRWELYSIWSLAKHKRLQDASRGGGSCSPGIPRNMCVSGSRSAMIHIPTDLCNVSCETFSTLPRSWDTSIFRCIALSVRRQSSLFSALLFRISLMELPSPGSVLLGGCDALAPRGSGTCPTPNTCASPLLYAYRQQESDIPKNRASVWSFASLEEQLKRNGLPNECGGEIPSAYQNGSDAFWWALGRDSQNIGNGG